MTTATRTTRQQLISRCRSLGVYLYDDGTGNGTLLVEAPHGHIIAGEGLHGLVAEYGDGAGSKPEAYADLADRLAYGIERCTETDCDNCSEGPMDPDEYARIYRTERIA
jgi:hypothetical protein